MAKMRKTSQGMYQIEDDEGKVRIEPVSIGVLMASMPSVGVDCEETIWSLWVARMRATLERYGLAGASGAAAIYDAIARVEKAGPGIAVEIGS